MADVKLIESYLNQRDWRVSENSNMTYSLQGLNNFLTTDLIAEYWLKEIYPKKISNAHKNGDLHIHNLGTLGAYCVGWDLRDLLSNGFTGAFAKTESRPAKHFRAALGQAVNFFYTLQGESAGAQAFSNFDTYLAPFIKKDGLNYREVKQAMQEFIYNMNVPTRVGFQTPFTNVTLDLVVPGFLREETAIIGGKKQREDYGDFQKELDLFNTSFAEIMLEGDASERIFTFPIPTYTIAKDFDWNSKVVKKVFELSAKYGVPYFQNFINSDLKPEDVRSMCCRLRIDTRELKKRGGGFFGANPLTGSIGVVTINMPRIGFLARDETDFFERLDELMDSAKESLEIKRSVLEKLCENGLYPYSKYYLRNIKKAFKKYWKNHFSTIGLVGMNESLVNFMGKSIASEEGRDFALKTLEFMREKLKDFQIETGNIYNLEATPAESTSYRFARIDAAKYKNIIVANDKAVRGKKAAPYYSNSTHLPVNYTEDIFEALELQDELQTKYTGGTVLHGFVGERINWDGARNLVKKIFENFRLPYLTITPTFSICVEHGYVKGEHFNCPKCGKRCEVYSRIVGYYRPIQNWNNGKKAEFRDRREYDLNSVSTRRRWRAGTGS
ncbi:ribonucleoside triphosphate reductase [Candidatus Micrarchaeota archaeon]|nr:ribonucleoside triphosphate reductase [Candidatus Micrarchaeota archaeon]